MQYKVYGPFRTPRAEAGVQSEALTAFWGGVDTQVPGLSNAIGIYVFLTCHGEKYTPWCVGKTNAKRGFRGEIFQNHKLSHYVSASQRKRGRPEIHLIAKLAPSRDNFCRASARSGREIDELETVMIGMALRANCHVQNSKKTWFNKNCLSLASLGTPSLAARLTRSPACATL